MTDNQNPNCRLYGYGNEDQLHQAMKIVMDFQYSFYYSRVAGKIRVQTRDNRVCIDLEREFKAIGLRTERRYDR